VGDHACMRTLGVQEVLSACLRAAGHQ
jgi:hypothetical protein